MLDAGGLPVGEASIGAAEILDSKDAMMDESPTENSIDGSFPSSLPLEVVDGAGVSGLALRTSVGPACLAWCVWDGMGCGNMTKRFGGA